MRLVVYFLLGVFSCHAVSAPRRGQKIPSGIQGESALLQRILSIEDHRELKEKTLTQALHHPSRRVVKAALLALGRLRDEAAIDNISAFLNRKDNEYKRYAAFALGLIGTDTTLKILQQHLQMQTHSEVLATLLFALGRAGNETHVPTVAAFLKPEGPTEINEAAARALGLLWSGPSEKWTVPADLISKLTLLAAGKEPVARTAAFALSRYKGSPELLPSPGLVDTAFRATSAETRAFLCRALGRLHTLESTLFLSAELTSTSAPVGVRVEAAKALATHPISEITLGALKKGIEDPSPSVAYQSLESAFNWGSNAQKLAEPIDQLFRTSSSLWLKGAALKALAGIQPTLGRQRTNEVLAIPSSQLTEAAVGALGILGTDKDLERLAGYLSHTETKIATAAIEALSHVPEARIPIPAKPALRKALERGDTALSALTSQLVERFKWKDFAPSLALVYPLLKDSDQVEAKLAVLSALGTVGDHSHLPLIDQALLDDERLVVLAAASARKAITGKEVEPQRIPPSSKITGPFPTSYAEVRQAVQSRIALKTSRGDIVIELLEDAPLTAYHISRLVKQGFYNGKNFHRVVPNFVVQGGDPRGDGYGGPGFLIRDELSMASHERGTVGIATAGPDTGGCQFFFNLGPNLHLDAKYTLFGEVISGMDVVDKLEVGDRILAAKLIK